MLWVSVAPGEADAHGGDSVKRGILKGMGSVLMGVLVPGSCVSRHGDPMLSGQEGPKVLCSGRQSLQLPLCPHVPAGGPGLPPPPPPVKPSVHTRLLESLSGQIITFAEIITSL